MSKVRMIALRSQYYGRDLKVDEPFEATEEHAVLLERAGAAKRESEPSKAKNEYRRRDLRAEK